MKMIRKLFCLLGFHKWVFVGRRTIFDILNGKGKTNYICKYCGKEKRNEI